jgi:hypothetical protein
MYMPNNPAMPWTNPCFLLQKYTVKTVLIHFKPCCKGPWNILEIKYAMKKSQTSKCLTVTQPRLSKEGRLQQE